MSETVQIAIVTAITTIVPVAIAAYVAIRQQRGHNEKQEKKLDVVTDVVKEVKVLSNSQWGIQLKREALLARAYFEVLTEPAPKSIAKVAAEQAEKDWADHQARQAEVDRVAQDAKKEQQ